MKRLFYFSTLVALISCNAKALKDSSSLPKKIYSADNKTVIVYTTADKTELRLTTTDTLQFKPMGQPLETQVCVFVNPLKEFQSFVGIGAALTDASAETYAKLPKDKQQELLRAYFDKEKGIGYTLTRTNINSCDSAVVVIPMLKRVTRI